MEEYDIRGYEEKKSVEPLPEAVQRAQAGLPPLKPKKSNAERQKAYRNRLKAKLGDKEFKQQQAQKMKAYRQERTQNTTVEESKITNKQTRGLVNNLLKTIEERIITMIQEQKHNPIPIHFENYIRKDEIEPVLVKITNSMSNREVIQAFVENDRKNPKGKEPAGEGTFEKYLTNINKIRKLYFGLDDNSVVFNDFEWLRDTEKVGKILKDNYPKINTYSTMINSISATLARMNHYQDIYINFYKPLNTVIAKQKKQEQLDSENKLTDREKKGFTTWDKILALEDDIKNTNINPVENLAIYYLYTQLPPRRLEYGNLVIAVENQFENNKKTNYVILDKKLKVVKKIILNTYKTSKKYGPYVIDEIPQKLSDAIVNLIDEQGYKAGEHLFMNSKGKAYGNSFSSRVKEVFEQAVGIPITLNTLRHSFISYHLKSNPTQKQKGIWANAMGHSTDTQGFYNRMDE